MSTELSNGVIIPEEYSDDWYDEMSINLRKLNDVITAASDNATDIQRLDTDKANQSDLTALTSRVSQNETDITALQTAVSGALKREIVQTLPTEDISTTTIYMIRNSQSSGTNIYDEYMYINSQWELIGTSATDFSNYYTKNETDNLLSGKVDNSTLGSYYTKTESDNLLSAKANQTDLTALGGRVTQTETDITALQTAVSGALKREIVQTLPTQDISTTTIYMIRNTTTSGDNIYDEYMYINNLWELIGTSATDFSNYYTKTEIDTLLSGKADDNSVVHTSGNETVGGNKTFTNNISLRNLSAEYGVTGGNIQISFSDKNNVLLSKIMQGCYLSGLSYTRFHIYGKNSNNQEVENSIDYAFWSNTSKAYFRSNIDNFIYLGTENNKWAGVYATNYYYGANNVEFSTKFVTTDTAQTVSGAKTFSSNVNVYNSDSTANTPNLILQSSKILVGDRTSSDTQSLVFNGGPSWISRVDSYKDAGGTQNLQLKIRTKDNDDNLITSMCRLRIFTDNSQSFEPEVTNVISLGRSGYKWKDCQTYQINGLTPSSMSIPNFSGRVDITSYISNLTGSTNNYTPSVNGWIYVGSNDASYLALFDTGSGGCGIRFSDGVVGEKYACIPCQASRTLGIRITCTNLVVAYFIPCLGNI